MAPHRVICIQGHTFLLTLQRLQTECCSKWQRAALRCTPMLERETIPAFYPASAAHRATKSATCAGQGPSLSGRLGPETAAVHASIPCIDRVQAPFSYLLLPEHPECILSCPCAHYYSARSASEPHPLCVSVMSADSAPSHVFCCVCGHIVCLPE